MNHRPPVTLQINLAPSDYRHAQWILPHQIRGWKNQVQEILLVIDLHRSPGRFSDNWEEGRDRILALAQSIEGARIVTVDYGKEATAAVSREFFGGRPVPRKDHRGGPYYAYFFGLHAAAHRHVLHSDADMLFGGGSETWVAEALDLLARLPDVLFTAPLPGPPASNGQLAELPGRRLPSEGGFAYEFREMSTRIFLWDRERFKERIGALAPSHAPVRGLLLALLEGNPPRELPEILFTKAMAARGLRRVDFLGTAPGRWSLHPPYRCGDFYARLPSILARVEAGDLPEAQRGWHDVNASLVDWSEAHVQMARRRWWRRLPARLWHRVRS